LSSVNQFNAERTDWLIDGLKERAKSEKEEEVIPAAQARQQPDTSIGRILSLYTKIRHLTSSPC
jgi:hypothetical protein